ncbi:MAG: hypothetical protein HY034_08745 [Nitrospirae bacterium]|nr:hypothetical protein [Nitrospirota bacterium]
MMILIKTIILILLFGVFIALWRLIGKHPESIIKMFPFINKRIDWKISNIENNLHIFSAETLTGKEAEFINERLPEKNKVIPSP